MCNFEKLIKGFQIDKNEMWAYPSEYKAYTLPNFGFKIHISATIKNAYYIFDSIKDLLDNRGLLYKIIASKEKLNLLNLGTYGYSQIGKFLTIYPPDDEMLNEILELLYQATLGFQSIKIPSDYRYKNSNIVFYRYGEMGIYDKKNLDKRIREIPHGIKVPINDYYISRYKVFPLKYEFLFCLRARGKSRVFQGIEKERMQPIIIKEGIMLGELDPLGVDGANSVMNEKDILCAVEDTNMFPKLIDYFYVGSSFYIIEEYVEGYTLLQLINELRFDFILNNKIFILKQVLSALQELYKRGIVMADFSADNIIINNEGRVFLIDTEYYTFKSKYKDFSRGVIGFWCHEYSGEKAVIYMFVSLWYYLFTPQEYEELNRKSLKKDYISDVDKYVVFNPQFEKLFSIEKYEEALKYIEVLIEMSAE